jgi:putative copper resistance protein D
VVTARQWWLLFAVPTSLVGVAGGWALARPEDPSPSSAVRALCLILGSVVLGLAALGWWGRTDSRPLVQDPNFWRLLTAVAGSWMAAEAVVFAMTAAEADALPLSGLTVGRFGSYVTDISAGRIDLAVFACTAAVTAWSLFAFRHPGARLPVAVAVVTAFAIVARPVTGHMSQQVLGSVLDAVHALAAATWFGLLAALAMTMRSRGDWSRWLPRYSDVAVWCVCLLTLTGVVDAAVRLGGVSALTDTGYGRIVVAKAVVLAALLALGWWWRRTWVGRASAHRMSADDSLRRAAVEVVAMAVAFGLAAALATTA